MSDRDDVDRIDSDDESAVGLRTICMLCFGDGALPSPVGAIFRGESRIGLGRRTCWNCDGRGRLLGMVPPV